MENANKKHIYLKKPSPKDIFNHFVQRYPNNIHIDNRCIVFDEKVSALRTESCVVVPEMWPDKNVMICHFWLEKDFLAQRMVLMDFEEEKVDLIKEWPPFSGETVSLETWTLEEFPIYELLFLYFLRDEYGKYGGRICFHLMTKKESR